MKFILNGEILDTELIWKITPITTDVYNHIYHRFQILFYNDKVVNVEKYTGCYLSGKYGCYEKDADPRTISLSTQSKNLTHNLEGQITLKVLQETDIYKETFNVLLEARDQIVDLWSQGQTSLPIIKTK